LARRDSLAVAGLDHGAFRGLLVICGQHGGADDANQGQENTTLRPGNKERPDYFGTYTATTAKDKVPFVLAATVFSAKLRDKKGRVVASYQRE
jgi:hypothetical protein